MDIRKLSIAGPVMIVSRKFSDARGFLSETYSEETFAVQVAPVRFVQENEDGLHTTVGWYIDNERWWRPLRQRHGGERLGLLDCRAN